MYVSLKSCITNNAIAPITPRSIRLIACYNTTLTCSASSRWSVFIPIFFIEKCHFEAAGGMMACNGTGIQTGYFNCYAHFNSTRFPYSSTSNLIAIILTFLLPLLFLL